MAKSLDGVSQRGPTSGQYFEERKKGEMNELKVILNKAINEQDSKKGREVVKKIIAYMTLGMDASPVFSEMCRASFTSDEITKKMIYFYLTTYAEDNTDLAIMAVNTFQKDCKHGQSKIRGLALRNLCSFRSADYVNNVLPIIKDLLQDFDPYVKKTAITGLLKIFYHDPTVILNDDAIIGSLSQLIRDSDSLVSVNAVVTLNQILVSEGGIPLTSKLVNYLYSRLKDYGVWQQSQVLQILYKYDPKDQKQHLEIITLLWEKLKVSSTSLVLSSIRIIIKLAKNQQKLFSNVVQKIKAPLLTLLSSNQNTGSFEIMFTILQHIDYVICHMDGKRFYEKDFKYFYCRYSEPTYIKELKVKILGELASENNLGDMLNQLNEYVIDSDVSLARKSVQIISDIAISLPDVAKALLTSLMSFYQSGSCHLANQSMIGFGKVLKKYPKLFPDLNNVLLSIDRSVINESQAIKSFIWILGTFAHSIQASPYILEEFVEEELLEKHSESIKSVFLTHVIQTFLKRPPQTYKLLTKTFSIIYNSDNASMKLKDHAAFYYRALKDNIEEVKRGFSSIEIEYSRNVKEKDRLSALLVGTKSGASSSSLVYENIFNNFCLTYRKKQNKFLKDYDHFMTMRNKQLGLIQPEDDEEGQEDDEQLLEKINNDINYDTNQLNNGQVNWTQNFQPEHLLQGIAVSAQEFEETWNDLPQFEEVIFNSANEEYLDEESVEELFKMWHLYCMASAVEDQLLKFFIYSKYKNGQLLCLELNIDKNSNKITILTKGPTESAAHHLNQYIAEFLRMNQFIVQ